MNDTERPLAWMKQRNLDMKQLAREMRMPYQTVYHSVTARPAKTGAERITGSFTVRFVATYGLVEASQIFAEFMMEPA